jgi:hypothetical protein
VDPLVADLRRRGGLTLPATSGHPSGSENCRANNDRSDFGRGPLSPLQNPISKAAIQGLGPCEAGIEGFARTWRPNSGPGHRRQLLGLTVPDAYAPAFPDLVERCSVSTHASLTIQQLGIVREQAMGVASTNVNDGSQPVLGLAVRDRWQLTKLRVWLRPALFRRLAPAQCFVHCVAPSPARREKPWNDRSPYC